MFLSYAPTYARHFPVTLLFVLMINAPSMRFVSSYAPYINTCLWLAIYYMNSSFYLVSIATHAAQNDVKTVCTIPLPILILTGVQVYIVLFILFVCF